MLKKTQHNLHIYIDADYKKETYHACAFVLRMQYPLLR